MTEREDDARSEDDVRPGDDAGLEGDAEREGDAGPGGESDTVGGREVEEENPNARIVRPGEAHGEPDVRPDLPLTPWQLAVVVGTVGWYLIIVGAYLFPGPVVVLLFLLSWPLLPLAMYLDTRAIADYTDWPRRRWLYLTVAFLWVFAAVAGTAYLWNRRQISEAGP